MTQRRESIIVLIHWEGRGKKDSVRVSPSGVVFYCALKFVRKTVIFLDTVSGLGAASVCLRFGGWLDAY